MTYLEIKAISNIVNKFIEDNAEWITSTIQKTIENSPNTDPYLSAIGSSISISSEIAVYIVLEFLSQAGLLSLDEVALRKLSLKILK